MSTVKTSYLWKITRKEPTNAAEPPEELTPLMQDGFYANISGPVWDKTDSLCPDLENQKGEFLAGFELRNRMDEILGVEVYEDNIYIEAPPDLEKHISRLLGVQPSWQIKNEPDDE